MYCQLIGFGLTVGWMWLFFLSGPVFVTAIKLWPGNPDYTFQFFLLCVSLAYLFSGKALKRCSFPIKKGLLITSAAFMSVSSGLICLAPRMFSGFCAAYYWFIYPLIAIGGFGLTLLLLNWLEAFLPVFSVHKFGYVYAGSIVIASILLFGGVMLDNRAGIIAVIVIPWLALLLILRQLPDKSPENAKDVVKQPFPLKLLWLIILFYIAGGMMFNLVATRYNFTNYFWISGISYMVVVILAACAIFFLDGFDLRMLCRPVLPLLAAGFILFPFLNGNYAIISFLLLQAGFALFDMYTWLVIVDIARGYSQPLPVLGLGMFWITFSIFGGSLAYTILPKILPFSQNLDSLAITASLITLLASFSIQDNKENLTGMITGKKNFLPSEVFFAASTTQMLEDKHWKLKLETLIINTGFTPRETEILVFILKGRNNPFIRESLNISPNTLKFHLKNIYQKLAVNNRQDLLSLFEQDHGDEN
jgi:DNA-binding CsgD family transcriptional regulator